MKVFVIYDSRIEEDIAVFSTEELADDFTDFYNKLNDCVGMCNRAEWEEFEVDENPREKCIAWKQHMDYAASPEGMAESRWKMKEMIRILDERKGR